MRWIDYIQPIASVVVVVIAFMALRTWKKQIQATTKLKFIDELCAAALLTHQLLEDVVEVFSRIKLQLNVYSNPLVKEHLEIGDAVEDDAIERYINEHKEANVKNIRDKLELVVPAATQLGMLMEKGRVFNFSNFNACEQANKIFREQFKQLQRVDTAFYLVLSTVWLYREDKIARGIVKEALGQKPKEISKILEKGKEEFLEFNKKQYQTLLSSD